MTPALNPPPDQNATESTKVEFPAESAHVESSAEPTPVELLVEPADGTPAVVDTPEALRETIDALAAGSGPVAVDAERAHGFRYSQRAYLVQLRRAGSGTHLIDPIAFGSTGPAASGGPADLSELGAVIEDAEWIIHAASQDLNCLDEINLRPKTLFDTELAGRLLGYPRVALGTMIEQLFDVRLLKEHSASDWSTRPLPPSWLTYAALDVELLVELRDALAAQLIDSGKWDWAQEEFAALAAGPNTPREPRTDPWRRTSGIHKIRNRRGLGLVAGLWYARDEIARGLDKAPGRILPDLAISELAAQSNPGRVAMRQIPAFSRRQSRKHEASWLAVLDEVAQTPEAELPALHLPNDGPPQVRLWAARDPVAATRLSEAREALTALAAETGLPVENMLTPDYLRKLVWRPPNPATPEAIDRVLASSGARGWQRGLVVPVLSRVLDDSQTESQSGSGSQSAATDETDPVSPEETG